MQNYLDRYIPILLVDVVVVLVEVEVEVDVVVVLVDVEVEVDVVVVPVEAVVEVDVEVIFAVVEVVVVLGDRVA